MTMKRRAAIEQMALAMGYTLSAPVLGQLLTSCTSDPKLAWAPEVLTNAQAVSLEAICEAILPRTATPGAKDLKVPQFIDQMLKHVMSIEDRKLFLTQLENFLGECKNQHGYSFEFCDTTSQKQFLDKHESEIPVQYPRIWGTAMLPSPEKNFFGRLKSIVVWGYFTTEQVGEQILSYLPIPGAYKACIPVEQVGNAWSLN